MTGNKSNHYYHPFHPLETRVLRPEYMSEMQIIGTIDATLNLFRHRTSLTPQHWRQLASMLYGPDSPEVNAIPL